jgi:hypothetical protein
MVKVRVKLGRPYKKVSVRHKTMELVKDLNQRDGQRLLRRPMQFPAMPYKLTALRDT